MKRYLLLAALLTFVSGASAIDLNSSLALQYYGGTSSPGLDFEVTTGGDASLGGNLALGTGQEIQSYYDQNCASDELVQRVYANGTYNCVDPSTLSSTESLAQTLSEGNFAGGLPIYMNQSGVLEIGSGNTNITSSGRLEAGADIDANSGDLDGVGSIYSDSGSTNFFSGGATSSETVTGIDSAGNLQTTSILAGNSNIAFSAVNRSQIIDGEVTSSELNTGVSGTGLSGGGGSSLSVNYGSSAGTAAEGDTGLDVSAGTGLSGGGTLTAGDEASSVSLGIAQGGVTNTLVAYDAVNQSQLAQGNCGTDEVLKWDGSSWVCQSASSVGTDDQNLQYSQGSNPASASNSQEIGIENGANITFQDVYNPNQTISGDLAYNNDTITLSDGSTATVYDRYRDADASATNERQGISASDDTITIYQTTSEGTSVDTATITDDTGTDDQNLQYTAPSISEALTRSQEIGIENGANITSFEDAYNPNQTLSTTDDTTGTNDTITLAGGNSIEVDDDFAADDQSISGDQAYINDTISLDNGGTATIYDRYKDGDTDQNNEIQSVQQDGNQITLSQDGTSIYVPYANNSDQLDGNEASYFEEESHAGEHDGAGLTNPSGDTLDINTDSDLAISSDQLGIATDGVNSAEIASGAVGGTQISDGSIAEVELDATNGPSDNQYLTYDSGSTGFTWVNNPDTDNQDLSSQNGSAPGGSSSVDQVVEITNGNNAALKDYYVPDDQSLSFSGQQLSLDNGGSVYVEFANNSDTVDSIEGSYLNTTISSITNSGQTQTITLSNGNEASFTDNVDDADSDATNERQGISASDDTITIYQTTSEGTSVDSATITDNTGTDDQTLSEVLTAGNTANQTINLGNNDLADVSAVAGGGNAVDVNDDLDVENQNITATTGNVSIGTDLKVWGDIWVQNLSDNTENLSETLAAGNTANQSIDMNSNQINNLADPTEAQDAATKNYVDNNVGTDDQNLQYSAPSISSAQTRTQEIGIENGNNITSFEDAYNPNQTISDGGETNGDDTIQLSSGGSVTINDNVADADADSTNEYQNLNQVLNNGTDGGGNSITNVQEVSLSSAGKVDGSSGDICLGDRC